MTPAWCPKTNQPIVLATELDGEGVTICSGCARPVTVTDGLIDRHQLPAVAAEARR